MIKIFISNSIRKIKNLILNFFLWYSYKIDYEENMITWTRHCFISIIALQLFLYFSIYSIALEKIIISLILACFFFGCLLFTIICNKIDLSSFYSLNCYYKKFPFGAILLMTSRTAKEENRKNHIFIRDKNDALLNLRHKNKNVAKICKKIIKGEKIK